MPSDNRAEQALEIFQGYLREEHGLGLESAQPRVGGTLAITVPHPYFLVDGTSILEGRMSGAEELVGYQALVFEDDRAVEAMTAAARGENVTYASSWTPDAADALVDALRLAEEKGRDTSDFAVVGIPEVGFNGVWLRQSKEVIPLATVRTRSALDPRRIYSEEEVVAGLREPLEYRFASVTVEPPEGEPEEPPIA